MLDATRTTNGPCLQWADGTGTAQQQLSSCLGKSQGRLDPPQPTCVKAATESKTPLQNCNLRIAATFFFIPGKEKCTPHPMKLLLGNGSNPEALLKHDQENTACKEYKRNKTLRAESRSLATYVGWFCPRSSQHHKPGQLLGDEKYDQIKPTSEEGEGWRPETSNNYPERCQAASTGKGSTLQSQDGHPPPARAEQPQGKSHSHQWKARLSLSVLSS